MINSFQDTFKELNLTQLEILAEKWAVKFSIEFERIILFKFLNPRQALHEDVMQASIPGRYFILFEISEGASSAFKKMIQATAEEAGILSGDLPECAAIFELWDDISGRYDRLLRATGQYETVQDPNINTGLKMLRDDNFHRVYKNKSDYIHDDWKFRVKDPDNKDLPLGIKEEDGYFWVLYNKIFSFIKKHKLRVFPTLIERDENIERAIWDRHIEPIVENYNLKNSLGKKFDYEFFTHPKTITELEMHLMLRKTMDLCKEFPQDPKDEDRDNFLENVMGRLRGDITEIRGIDLKDMFRSFLIGLFNKKRMRDSQEYSYELPVFLALVNLEYAESEYAKSDIDSEQDRDVFIKEGDDTVSNIFRETPPSWEIVYNNRTPLRGLRGKGFSYIHFLVKHPKKEYHTNLLAVEVDKIDPDNLDKWKIVATDNTYDNDYDNKKKKGTDHRDVLYGNSMIALKKHWNYLKQEHEKAKDDNDPGRIDKTREELETFEGQFSKSIQHGGKSRQFTDDTTKNKNRISKSIKRALETINKHDEDTWRHFYSALDPIHSYYLSYTPDRNINWLTE